MNKHYRNGFSIVVVPLFVLVLGVIAFAAMQMMKNNDASSASDGVFQSAKSQTDQTSSDSADENFELQNLGLVSVVDSVDISTQALRDYDSNGLKGFYGFGENLSGGRTNPNLEFASVRSDAAIVAAVDGMIVNIKQQEGADDYEVFLMTSDNSAWIIGYDHLSNVKVAKGDMVKAGDVLGNAAVQNNGIYRFEFQVNKRLSDGSEVHYCPTVLLAENTKKQTFQELETMLAEWEKIGGTSLYDESAFTQPLCTQETITPQAAEGR